MNKYSSIISSAAGIMFGFVLVAFMFIIFAIIESILASEIPGYILATFTSLPPEYLSGFISGIIATLIGFSLTIAWDIFKFYRDHYINDNAILSSARHELDASCQNIRTNMDFLNDEKESLKKNKYIVMPLLPLSRDIWELVKFNLPRKLSKNPALLAQVCDTSYSLSNLDEGVRSRENFRINNQGMSNYKDRLEIYNDLLLNQMNHVLTEIIDLRKNL